MATGHGMHMGHDMLLTAPAALGSGDSSGYRVPRGLPHPQSINSQARLCRELGVRNYSAIQSSPTYGKYTSWIQECRDSAWVVCFSTCDLLAASDN